MNRTFNTVIPSSIEDAYAWLSMEGSMPLAGGTGLLVALRDGAKRPSRMVLLDYLPELTGIRDEGDKIVIGAAVTHSELIASEIVGSRLPLLALSAFKVGSVQIRNRGTIGGNVANASPAADTVPALRVHDAVCVLGSRAGERRVSLEAFQTGPGSTMLAPGELILRFEVPVLPGKWYVHFEKLGQRKAMACAKISCAAAARIEKGVVSDIRLALAAVAPTVLRLKRVEEHIVAKGSVAPDDGNVAKFVAETVSPIDDIRSSADYRAEMSVVLVRRALRALCSTRRGR